MSPWIEIPMGKGDDVDAGGMFDDTYEYHEDIEDSAPPRPRRRRRARPALRSPLRR